jgi:hypothetical protein
MSVNTDSLIRLCNAVSRQISENMRSLTLRCVVHHSGQRAETLALEEHDILIHPAGRYARHILNRKIETDQSAFLGLACASEKKFFGLAVKNHLLAVITLNADTYPDLKAARQDLYHLSWHVMDLCDIREQPHFKNKFRNAPMIPRRSPMNQARANLRADVFSAAMLSLEGDSKAIGNLAFERALGALTPNAQYRAESFPYVIATEAAQFACREACRSPVPKDKILHTAKQIADKVGKAFEEASIRQWWAFSKPAQDMAWRGHTKEEILGAAINTSNDPYVRAAGVLLHEITTINPADNNDMRGIYNAYTDTELNSKLHREAVDDVFDGVMAQGIFENNGTPFLTAANEQNNALTEGRIIGWCAAALQAAATAFENALARGESPAQAARQTFEDQRDKTEWDTIKKLGDKIIEQRRQGYALTFDDLLELSKETQDLKGLRQSLQSTLNDPAFQSKLAASADLGLSTAPAAPGPSIGPKPQTSAPHSPEYAPVPGLGGGSPARRTVRTTDPSEVQDESRQ